MQSRHRIRELFKPFESCQDAECEDEASSTVQLGRLHGYHHVRSVTASWNADMKPSDAASPVVTDDDVMERFRRGDLVFDVDDAGPEDGPIVVLLHGHPQTSTAWEAVIPRLVESGYRCLAPDQRGISPAARPTRRRDYRMSELVEDVGALIDASGAPSVRLVGHDFGALVAWAFAAKYPQKVVSLTSLSGPHPGALQYAMLTSRQGLKSWYAYAYQLPRLPERYYMGRDGKAVRLAQMLKSNGQKPELAERDARVMAEPGAYSAALNWYRAIPWSGRTGDVSVPTMLVWSDGDKFIRLDAARRSARYVEGVFRLEILRGTSHWIPDEQPDATADLLLDWFAPSA
jgi:pimeloyl-ACP methyl ester carboxylesterase